MRKIPLSLQIAFRFSQGQQYNCMLSLISVISTIGIALGVAVLIVGLSAMNGFERELSNRILAMIPHGEIEPVNSPFADWQTITKQIEQVPGILAAVPYLNFTGLVEHYDKLHIIKIKGIDPSQKMQLCVLSNYIQNDGCQSFHSGKRQIIIGKKIANMLNVNKGDWLTIIIPNSNPQMNLLQIKRIQLQVNDTLALSGQLNHNFAIVPLLDAQQYLQREQDIDGIAIKVNDIFSANKLVRSAGEVTNIYVKVSSWISTYGYMYRDIQMIRAIMYLAMVLVIGVACFNIISILVVAVKNKSADIAILQTLGSKNNLIRAIFIWYGLLASLAGSIIGVLVGVLVAINLTMLVRVLEYFLGYRLLSSDIYFIDFLPTELHYLDVLIVLITTILLSLLASWYPAQRAIRIDPAKILSSQ